MKKSYRTALIIVALIIIVLFSGYLFPSADSENITADMQNNETELIAVRVINSKLQPYAKDIILRGYTEALRTVSLKSQIKAKIIALPIQKGMRVVKGDVICRLDIEDRQANYTESLALIKQRQLEYAASEKLFAKGHRSETQHSAAKSALDAALARGVRMKINLENTVIRAPFDGVINDRLVEIGDYMKEGEVCALIMEENPFLVVASIPEKETSQVKVGDVAHAILQNGRHLTGKIRYISAIADVSTRTFRVELEIENPNRDILAGITAEMIIKSPEIMAQKISPATLVLNDAGLVGVRMVDDNDIVYFQEAEILGNHDSGIWIGGIKDHSKIIIQGHEFVKAGEPVNAVFENP